MAPVERRVNDRAAFEFFSSAAWIIDAMYGAMLAFPTERAIIDKERRSGAYRLSAYFLAKSASEVPIRLLLPCLYAVVAYWMAGMRASLGAFAGFLATTLLAVLAGEAIGLLIGATVLDVEKALVLTTLVSLTLMLTGGFFVRGVPAFFAWVQYLSPFKYAYDAGLLLEFPPSSRTTCDGSAILKACRSPDALAATGRDVLDYFGTDSTLGFNLGLLLVLGASARIAAYLALRFFTPDDRGRT
mmetsp:Transcript_62213/g.140710  ORF Transcript_62213/g.140710 Transcript_62213/m.140710 type:complete len:243 (+) Transcript_62213:3-731(+)